jgi:hypothetical protein
LSKAKALANRATRLTMAGLFAVSCSKGAQPQPDSLLDRQRRVEARGIYNSRVKECMKRQGFEYFEATEKPAVIPALVASLDELRSGYGVKITSIRAGVELPSNQMGAYQAALGNPSVEGSCLYQTKPEIEESARYFKALNRLKKAELRDKVIRAIDLQWSQCMSRAGHKVSTPWDMSDVVSDKAVAVVSTDDPAERRDFENWQMRIADEDAKCRKGNFEPRRRRQLSILEKM